MLMLTRDKADSDPTKGVPPEAVIRLIATKPIPQGTVIEVATFFGKSSGKVMVGVTAPPDIRVFRGEIAPKSGAV